jgi:hypothetical protein
MYGVYKNVTADFQTMCLRTCINDAKCDSVNYRPSDLTCELIAQTYSDLVNATDVKEDSNWEWWSNQYTNWN